MSLLKRFWREAIRRPVAPRQASANAGSNPTSASVDDASFRHATVEAREAMRLDLSQTLATRPGTATDWTRLGDWSLDLGMPAEAEVAFRRALHLQPLHARAHEGIGLALLTQGHLDEAYLRLETATRLTPDNGECWIHWGLVDLEFGRLDGAADKFQRGIDRAPSNSHGWHNLALVAMKRGETARSIELFKRAIELKPDHGLAYSNMALALMLADRLPDALTAAIKATELKPTNARVRVVLADVHIARGDTVAAGAALDRADSIDHDHVGARICRAKLALLLGQLDDAARAFERALAADPSNPEARTGLGQVLLQRGDWSAGWTLYEARRETATTPVRQVPFPEWQGGHCGGRGVLVHGEQGMGDIILFASCLEDLHRLGARILLDVPQRLTALFARSFPWAEVVCGNPQEEALTWHSARTPLEMQVPIGSLPRWLRQRSEQFRDGLPFLRADQGRVDDWRTSLGKPDRPIVGLTWQGGLSITGKYQRSLALRDLVAALGDIDATFVSLQHGDVAAELGEARTHHGVDIHPGLSGYVDLDELAALTAACDGVVTVCSTQAHLTGGLGIPGLVLVPSASNWRYGVGVTKSPWYGSLVLARQSRADDWSAPLAFARDWLGSLGTSA